MSLKNLFSSLVFDSHACSIEIPVSKYRTASGMSPKQFFIYQNPMAINAQSEWNRFNRIQMGRITQYHLKLWLIELQRGNGRKRRWMMEFGTGL